MFLRGNQHMSPHSLAISLSPYFSVILLLIASISFSPDAQAEYGDIVINNFSDKADIRPVIFPHWFHRIRFSCKVCHSDIGFQMKAGANKIDMLKIINGEFCGNCHNGETAWSVGNCELCHSAIKNTPTQVHRGAITELKPNGKNTGRAK